jgi:hypothetical protein
MSSIRWIRAAFGPAYHPRMDWIIAGIVVVALIPLGMLAQRRGWIDLSGGQVRRGGGVSLGAVDEVFAPTRHEALQELERQTELVAPAPVPGDRGVDHDAIYRGSVVIRL